MSSNESVRIFHVFAVADPALGLATQPGHLHSMAAPPPGFVPPEHPFIDAFSHNPLTEHTLRGLLLESVNADDFLARLVAAGFDLAADTGQSIWTIQGPPLRVFRESDPTPIAAIWHSPGPFATLSDAPPRAAFDHATATVYVKDVVDAIFAAVATTTSFSALLGALGAAGFEVRTAAVAHAGQYVL